MDESPPRSPRSGAPIAAPEPAYVIRQSDDGPARSDDEREREATELRPVQQLTGAPNVKPRDVAPGAKGATLPLDWATSVRAIWRRYIRLSVPHVDCRDHLANERTYLGYLRSSLALSMLGVLISQLYRLQHALDPSPVFGYFVLSKPIACIFQGAALCVSLLGAIRFYRQQSAMAVGKVHVGGWEIYSISVGVFLLLLAMLAIHVGIDVYKEV